MLFKQGRSNGRIALTHHWNRMWNTTLPVRWWFQKAAMGSDKNPLSVVQGQHPWLCALSIADILSCPKSIGSIGGTPIFQRQQYSNCSKAGGCRVAPLMRGFGRNVLIVSRVTSTPGCTRVQLIFQEIDTASRVFCAHRADLPKSYLGTCRVSDQNNFHPFFAVYI